MSRVHPIVLALLFVSGLTGLTYEVLWLEDLRHLFGNTAHATSATLAIFFFGLALGSVCWGAFSKRTRHPLFWYGALEALVAITIPIFWVIDRSYYDVSAWLLPAAPADATSALLKLCVATLALLPPTFLMGGTVPLMIEAVAGTRRSAGQTAGLAYAVNIMGAAVGALLAGFLLPAHMGMRNTYWLMMALSAAAGIAAMVLGLRGQRRNALTPEPAYEPPAASLYKLPAKVVVLSFASGFGAIGLEVLWVAMFAQVTINCVYSFSVVLITFLVSLATGAGVALQVAKRSSDPWKSLQSVLLAAALLVASTPLVFFVMTSGLKSFYAGRSWVEYILCLFAGAFVVLLIPVVLLGSVFPLLIRLSEGQGRKAGALVGHLAAVNTAGATFGSLAAGMIMLGNLGLWRSIEAFALLYVVAAFALRRVRSARSWGLLVATAAAVLAVTFWLPSATMAPGDVLEALYEGAHGHVAVVRSPSAAPQWEDDDKYILLNNYYSLGGMSSVYDERRMARLPLLLHPSTKSIFFIGMGTGITAAASLDFPVESVVVTELSPQVVKASKQHFASVAGRLFTDDRAKVLVADGRSALRASSTNYDMIVGDLFRPWSAGAGHLFSLEHFRAVRARLDQGGVFVQWLPLYQLSEDLFGIIARTMLEVFPQVVVWAGNFDPDKPIMALMAYPQPISFDIEAAAAQLNELLRSESGSRAALETLVIHRPFTTKLDPSHLQAMRQSLSQVRHKHLLTFYMGSLTEQQRRLLPFPINSENHPVLAYLAPQVMGRQKTNATVWLKGPSLLQWRETWLSASGAPVDRYMAQLPQQLRHLPAAGLDFYRYTVAGQQAAQGNPEASQQAALYFRRYLAGVGLVPSTN